MRKWILRVAVVAVLVAAVFAARATVLRPKPVPVETVEVARGEVEETVTNSRAGSVKARRRANLSPEIGGQVVEIPHREGDRVAAGAVLLRIDDRSERARLELSRRELDSFRAERDRACLAADRAGRELDRTRRLAQEEIVSADLLDGIESAKQTADAACLAARANVDRAAAAVAVARTQLDKAVIRAPFDGVVAEVSTEVGEWTTPSPPAMPVPPVLDLLDPTSIYISAPMDEVDSARVHVGQSARVTVDSHRGRDFAGRVLRVAPYVLDLEEQNRTVEIEVELADAELAATLLPGTSADVEVILQVREGVLRVPTGALMDGNRLLLFRAGELAEQQIETGLRNWDYTEVTGGLDGGERLVTSLDSPEVKAGARAELAEGD